MHLDLSMYEKGLCGKVRRIALTSLLFAVFAAISTETAHAASSVTLAWDPSASAGVAGYNIYYGPSTHTYTNMVTAGNATNVTVSGLIGGATYYFAATAYDSFGVESDYSSETNYVVPSSGNQAPTLNAIANLTISENAAQQTVNLSGITSGSPTESQTLTVTATSDNTGLIPNPSVTYTSPNTTGTLRFTPVANANGLATMTVTVNDGQASNNLTTRTFKVTVNSVNSAPTITAIPNQTIAQDSSSAAIPFTVGDVETAAASLTVSAASSNPGVVPVSGIAFGGSGANRTVTITPAAGKSGTANITVSVSDGTATTSANFAATVQAASAPSLSITINGNGKVTPDPTRLNVVAGATYTFTATPDSGSEFQNWTGTLTSDSTSITVKVTNSIALQANFVLSPFLPLAGTYNGLFYEGDQVRETSAGAVALTLTTRGKYSGKVQLGSHRYPFTGKLTLGCVATNAIKRAKTLSPLTLTLRVGTNGEIDQIFGNLTDGSWISGLTGDRALYNSRTNPAPAAGLYTFVIPGSFDSTQPRGHSYGTARVSTSGVVTYAGSLSDSSHVTQSSPLSKHSVWPLYAAIAGGSESVLAWLTFTNQASSDISGQLSWIKSANVKARYYSNGFDYVSSAAGSAFHAPGTNDILTAGAASVDFSGGNLAADFSNLITIGPRNKVTNMGNNKLSLGFGLANGIYHGLVTDPTTGKTMPYSGAVFQKMNVGYGFLLGTSLSSRVDLSP
jgi:List-Bact-rpt repeat protein/fibronectin type III domain protein